MQVHVNAKNVLIALILFAFLYLTFLLWGGEERYPQVEIDLRDLVRLFEESLAPPIYLSPFSYVILAAEMGGHAIRQLRDEHIFERAMIKGKTAEGRDEYVTRADLVSNHFIMETLQRLPALKIISEERESGGMSEKELEKYRANKYELWLHFREIIEQFPHRKRLLSRLSVWVDPLDATQEYTEDLLEYVSVMICICYDSDPIFGVVYRPFFNETVIGMADWGVINNQKEKWTPETIANASRRIVVSRSHAGTVQSLAHKAFGREYLVEPAGGAGYKTLRLINGTADLYIHNTAIKKWDTCAGDALIRAIGGSMVDLEGAPIDYASNQPSLNKKGLFVAIDNPYTEFERLRPFLSAT